jgi:hypothetical protein
MCEPAPLYAAFYQPFWAAHHLTWLVAKAARQNPSVSFEDFCQQLQDDNDEDAILIMGRGLAEQDLTDDYVVRMSRLWLLPLFYLKLCLIDSVYYGPALVPG